MNDQSAALAKRSRELDEQEARVDAKLKDLAQAPLTFEVYDAQIKGKIQQLADLHDEIAEIQGRLRDLSEQEVEAARTAKEKQHQIELHLAEESKKANEQLAVLHNEVKDSQLDLTKLKTEIDDRKKYLTQQEGEIERIVNSGNERIMELHAMAGALEREIDGLVTDKLDLRGQVDDLSIQVADLQETINDRRAASEHELEQLHSQMGTLRRDIAEQTQKLREVTEETTKKLAVLNEKESSLASKQDALILERQELDQKLRQFERKQRIYNL